MKQKEDVHNFLYSKGVYDRLSDSDKAQLDKFLNALYTRGSDDATIICMQEVEMLRKKIEVLVGDMGDMEDD